MIQENINRAISTGALMAGLYTQTPKFKEAQEYKTKLTQLSKRREAITKRIELEDKDALTTINAGGELSPEQRETYAATGNELENITRESYELNPTAEGLEQLYQVKRRNAMINPNNRAAIAAQRQGQQNLTLQDRIEGFKNMSVEEGREFLKQAQHIQSQRKREDK